MTGDSHLSTHPPLPPTTEDDRVAWVRLLRSSRIGPATFFKLLSEQGSAQAALAHLPERAKEAGLTEYTPCPAAVARAELKRGRAAGARPVFHGSAEYPSALNDLPDPPPMLWIKGDAALLSRPTLSLIGARTASSLGLRMARRLAQDLGAAGFTIVFGLARGIDAAAHEGALPTGTVAILPGGIDQPYPAQNADLMAQIAATGLLIAEEPPGTAPHPHHFPKRNRLVADLSPALVVVEAALKSGSLQTARTALDLGRDILAVPGHPFELRAAGCNQLIRDGARLVTGAPDILAALSPMEPLAPPAIIARIPIPAPPPERRPWRQIAALHNQLLARLTQTPMSEDDLLRATGATPSEAAPALLELEMDGQITRQPGGFLSRK